MDRQRCLFSLLFAVVCIGVAPTNGAKGNDSSTQHSKFLNKIFKHYDKRVRPNFDGPPVNVTCDVFISSIDSFTETTMSYEMVLYMRQNWNDPRLKFNDYNHTVTVDVSLLDNLWFPDLYFPSEKKAETHDITTDNKLLRLSPNGDILYSIRLSLLLSCPMKFHQFPMDNQTCTLQLESYGYTTEDVIFTWREGTPVDISGDVELPTFSIVNLHVASCTKWYSTGAYTCLEAIFYLNRQIGYYIIQIYLPTTLIVVISWLAFWISPDCSPARVALGITTVLTMTTQSAGANSSLPKVSYIKAIDVWMSVCLIFVISAMLEFACVSYQARKKKNVKDSKPKFKNGLKQQRFAQGMNGNVHQMLTKEDICQISVTPDTAHKSKGATGVEIIDRVCRFAFPISFAIFNAVYWTLYSHVY
ncbi:glycine receptor subunit alpha-2-like [Anneissia japonica]|uniref:glycine receptor subunit alpha-2-like n=1 Tax=Anneissia japonica TaxID=1529436 RepID=UPI00142590D4|nr:glycine receptor subunit alpha-2-like [Anneissia japonica]